MRGDFETYLNDEFRDESGKLDLNALLAIEDEAAMDVAVIMPTPQPNPRNDELADVIRGNQVTSVCLDVLLCIRQNLNQYHKSNLRQRSGECLVLN